MSSTFEPTARKPSTSRKAKRRKGLVRFLATSFLAFVVIGGGAWAYVQKTGWKWSGREDALPTRAVDQGDVRVFVLESGSLESSDNATIKCQVEALMGMVAGGLNGGANNMNGGRGGMGGQAGAQGGGATAPQAAPAAQAPGTGTAKGAGGGAGGGGAVGKAGGGGAGGGGMGGGAMAGGGGMGGGGGGAGAGGGAGGGGAGMMKPMITSFSMVVTPHVPLRPKAPMATTKGKAQGMGGMQGMQGGGGGGNRGGGGGMDPGGDKAGSTKILSIIPEGSRVKEGDIVCELDAAAFRDELQSQVIRWEQAKAWVDQAREILKVSEISLLEYRDGILPRDMQQIEKYIEVCQTQLKQAQSNLKWSREMTSQSLQSASQLRSSEYAEEQMRIVVQEAEGMKRRLVNYTAPKLMKNLEAKIDAVKADLLAQEAALQLEAGRKTRLEKMIEYCTLRAPRDGMIAYNNASTGSQWNPTVTLITEGVTVRQGQTILLLPDPKKMRVKVRVNESKVSQIYTGQRAYIQVEAYPDHPLTGKVTEITAIPAPASGMASDVKLYYANVEIDEGFDGLRTGLTAQVSFFVAEKPDVTRISLDSIRWADGLPYAAVSRSGDGRTYEWRPLRLGLVGTSVAEVVSGVRTGEAVVADPNALPAPPPSPRRVTGPVAAEKPRDVAG